MKHYCIVETRAGFMGLVERNGKLMQSTLPKPSRDEAFDAIKAGLGDSFVEDNSALGTLPGKLIRYFEGEKVDFSDVPLDLSAYGLFYAKVLKATQQIPYGTLTTYGNLARTAGSDGAARAAGSAMAQNMMLIVVPCHRVVAAGNKIGGFSSGMDWKRTLLKLEGVDI